MIIASTVIVFILVWWSVFFCVLPFGNDPAENNEHQVGNVASAPKNPRIGLKLAISTVIAIFLTGIIIWLINIRLIDWHAKARELEASTKISAPVSSQASSSAE